MDEEKLKFLKRLTLINRATVILLTAAFIGSFFVPVPTGTPEQVIGWLQGVVGTLVAFQIANGEDQNKFWFKTNEFE